MKMVLLGIFMIVCPLVAAQETMQYSRHPVSGVVIEHPANWEAVVTSSYIAALSPAEDAADIYRENVNIMLQPVVRGTTLSTYARSSHQALLTSDEGVADVTMADTTWSGVPAVRFAYTVRRNVQGTQLVLRYLQVMRMLYDDVVAISTFSADALKYDTFLPIANKITASVTIQQR